MPFQPGQSGNPHGRPKRGRALAELLEAVGLERLDLKGKQTTNREALAGLVWQGATTGSIKLGRRVLRFSTGEWLELVKFIHAHVDGPKSALDVTSGGEPINFAALSALAQQEEESTE